MATIGQPLTAPEAGWQRIDITDAVITKIGTWPSLTNASAWNGSALYGTGTGRGFNFNFTGTKIRIIVFLSYIYNSSVEITIDGVKETFSCNLPTNVPNIYQVLAFEKLELADREHSVAINNTASLYMSMDAIDIDSTKTLKTYNDSYFYLNNGRVKPTLGSMKIGDAIVCKYFAPTSGAIGTFSELGTCTASEIPRIGTANPNGLFYFVKADKGLLIADRVIQHSISWDVLNNAKMIEGAPINIALGKPVTGGSAEAVNWPFSKLVNGNATDCAMFNNITDSNQNSYTALQRSMTIDLLKVEKLSSVKVINGGACSSFDLEYSQDNLTFTKIGSYSPGLNSTTIFPMNVSARYIRLYNILSSATSNANLSINEVEICSSMQIRSLSGGCAYVNANGNLSTTDAALGAFPANNEWDKYIVNSDLNKTITKGDDNTWHWSNLYTWTKDTPSVAINTNTRRVWRGKTSSMKFDGSNLSSNILATGGFRPVLEYVEPDDSSKQTTLWY